jgi:hypothetical protein
MAERMYRSCINSACRPSIVVLGRSVDSQPFHGLPGDLCYEFEGLVEMENGEPSALGHRGHEQVGYGWCPVFALIGEQHLDLYGPLLHCGGEVLDWHQR